MKEIDGDQYYQNLLDLLERRTAGKKVPRLGTARKSRCSG
jgi:hypothetical protein